MHWYIRCHQAYWHYKPDDIEYINGDTINELQRVTIAIVTVSTVYIKDFCFSVNIMSDFEAVYELHTKTFCILNTGIQGPDSQDYNSSHSLVPKISLSLQTYKTSFGILWWLVFFVKFTIYYFTFGTPLSTLPHMTPGRASIPTLLYLLQTLIFKKILGYLT